MQVSTATLVGAVLGVTALILITVAVIAVLIVIQRKKRATLDVKANNLK